jgi:hypothetical protein
MQLKIRPLTILFFSVLLLLLNPGCLIIPQGHKNIELSGKRIEEEKLNFVVPGKTTKAEFIEKVGQPYLMMDDFGVMAYYWKMLAAYMPWLLVGYTGMAGGMEELSLQYMLLVAFNDNGCITKYETIRPILVKTVNERAIEWAGKGEVLGKFTPLKIPEDKSAVYIFFRSGSWLDGLDKKDKNLKISGVFLDGKLWAEIDLGQYTPIVLPPGTYKIGVEPNIRATNKFLTPNGQEQPEPLVTTTIDTFANKAYYLEIKSVESSNSKERQYYFARPSPDEALPILAKLKRVR